MRTESTLIFSLPIDEAAAVEAGGVPAVEEAPSMVPVISTL